MNNLSLNSSIDHNRVSEYRIAMNRKRRKAIFRKQLALLVLAISLLIFVGGLMIGTVMSDAQSNTYEPAFKYYKSVTVHSDDTLRDIASEYFYPERYSDLSEYITEICSINNIGDPDMIKSGEALIVPYYSTEYK
jgi:nucleoid-associated protein YgaU